MHVKKNWAEPTQPNITAAAARIVLIMAVWHSEFVQDATTALVSVPFKRNANVDSESHLHGKIII